MSGMGITLAVGESGDSALVGRAWRFLLGSQKGDGSWLVKTRNPNSHDVIISYYGTGWATLGLIRSLPSGGSARRDRGPGEGPPRAEVGAGATR